ncbi:unnamed protein product [Schistosoma margrebowiei]|uniref:Uncharacterized protein n=1 Tax=Schistosoma margrebowiei TaxID=48269 RepID=A0A183M035_9TREM|nr:unnamed protein product [Schistosoma margrebowiei]
MTSFIDQQEGSNADVKARIGKTRAAFLQLKNIWNTKQTQSKSEYLMRTSTQFYYTDLKLAELPQLSSRRYTYL